MAKLGDQFLAAFQRELRDNPDAFGLRNAMDDAGQRLIQTLDDLNGRSWAGTPQEQVERFVAHFVREVAGSGGLVVNAMVRRSARRCAERLIAKGLPIRLNGELFCAVYKLFFAGVVDEFAKAVIVEQIKLAVPILPLVDPADVIVERVSEKIAALIPDPCAAKEKRGAKKSLVEVAHDLLKETVERVLGLHGGPEIS